MSFFAGSGSRNGKKTIPVMLTIALALAGCALHDPLASLVFCQPPNVDLSIVNGVRRVEGGRLLGHDLDAMVARHNACARRLVEG